MIPLLASYWTIAGDVCPLTSNDISVFDFKDRVEALAKAGYSGMGLYIRDVEQVLRRYSYSEIRTILKANGISHIELEYLANWFEQGLQATADRNEILSVAESLGAHHIKVCPPMSETNKSMPHLIDTFGKLCEQAQSGGIKIALEIQAGSVVSTVESALTIIYGSGTANGGILLDIWHFARGNIPYQKINQIPVEIIVSVELSDASSTQQGSILEDTLHHRRFCGEGDLRPSEFISQLYGSGYNGFYAVEILSDELRQLPLEIVAKKSFETTISQFPFPIGTHVG